MEARESGEGEDRSSHDIFPRFIDAAHRHHYDGWVVDRLGQTTTGFFRAKFLTVCRSEFVHGDELKYVQRPFCPDRH